MSKIIGANFIAGKTSKKGKNYFNSINPRTQELANVKFFEATKDEINESLNFAEIAFKKTKKYSKEKLADFLITLSNEIENIYDLVKTADWETSLGKQRLLSERSRTCNQLKLFSEYIKEGFYVEAIIDTANTNRKPNSKPDVRRMLVPIGPVVVFEAINFPFAFGVCGGDSASAWAVGCPVIVKSNPSHPQTAELFARATYKAIEKCQFPKGFFSLVHGTSNSVGEELVRHPKVQAVGFTGSVSAGKSLFLIAASRPKPVPFYAEMGSINPVFITKEAIKNRIDEISENLFNSITLSSGQFCTKPGIIIVPDFFPTKKMIDKISDLMQKKESQPLLSKNIVKGLEKRVEKTINIQGIKLITGGNVTKNETSFENTLMMVDSTIFLKNDKLQKEHFGPVVVFITCKKLEEYIEIIEKLEGQLTATIYLEKSEYGETKPIISKLTQKVGRLIIDGVPTGVEVCNAMNHGGPFPSTTAPHTTSVGMTSIKRFLRPVAYQNFPNILLPKELQNKNHEKIFRIVNGKYTNEDV